MTNDVKRKAEELKIEYFETSALDGSNIEHAFDVIVEEMSHLRNYHYNKYDILLFFRNEL